jgi:hypothetical protein
MKRRAFVQTGMTAGALATMPRRIAALSSAAIQQATAGSVLLDANENPLADTLRQFRERSWV